MPGMVPTTASMSRARSVTTVSRWAKRSSSMPTTLASSGDTSCSDRVALGSSLASSIATPLSRSVRMRSAQAESERDGSDESSVPTACSRPETACEMPERGQVDSRSRLVDATLEPLEQCHQAIHPFGDVVDGVERGQSAEEGRRSNAPGKRIIVSSNDGDSTG